MTQFALFATLLVVVDLPPSFCPCCGSGLRRPKTRADPRRQQHRHFRDQLTELEREKAEGSLAEADFDRQRRTATSPRLRKPSQPPTKPPRPHVLTRKTAIAIPLQGPSPRRALLRPARQSPPRSGRSRRCRR